MEQLEILLSVAGGCAIPLAVFVAQRVGENRRETRAAEREAVLFRTQKRKSAKKLRESAAAELAEQANRIERDAVWEDLEALYCQELCELPSERPPWVQGMRDVAFALDTAAAADACGAPELARCLLGVVGDVLARPVLRYGIGLRDRRHSVHLRKHELAELKNRHLRLLTSVPSEVLLQGLIGVPQIDHGAPAQIPPAAEEPVTYPSQGVEVTNSFGL